MLTVGKPHAEMDLSALSKVRAAPFLWRFLLYGGLVAGFAGLAAGSPSRAVAGIAMILLGLVYAHGVELQHQTLHNTAFPSRRWNRIAGFFLGLPMLVSFSNYQHSHLRHHRLVGTAGDREFFSYEYGRLTTLKPLLAHLLMIHHYREVFLSMGEALLGRLKPDMKGETARRIRFEYCAMALLLAAAFALSIAFQSLLLLKIWLIPLLIAIPAHALVELPEHWGRDHDTPDLRANTRTIATGPLGFWFTNGNNYHTEHHWLPSVPNDRFPELHRRIAAEVDAESYPAFYRRFFLELCRNTFKGRQDEATA